MKRKDIDKCQYVNLSTDPKDILDTMLLELPSVNYFFRKDYGGKNKFLKHEDTLLDKALAEEKSQITDISEYISPKGNRWMSYNFIEYFPKAKYAQAWPTSFIYYETYGSCGAFFPLYRKAKNGKITEIYGVLIFTSHFFQRMSERTGKAYRSRGLIQEFITTKETHAVQADEEGDVIIKFKGGYGFGKLKSKEPYVLEIRTYLTDEQLSPSQKYKCENIDAYAELISDGAFIKEVSIGNAYYSTDTPEESIKQFMHKFKLAKKIGADRKMMLTGLVYIVFIDLMHEILNINLLNVSTAQTVAIAHEIGDCYRDFVNKYEFFDSRKATTKENQQFRDDLVECYVNAAKKLKLKGVTKEVINAKIDKVLSKAEKK